MSGPEVEVVDGMQLPDEHRALLRPGEPVEGKEGIVHRLPRFFFSVASWPEAHRIKLAPHLKLSELMMVDSCEADLLLHQFPHYVPCAIVVLARYLESFRREADAAIFVSANGGYRSPAHGLSGNKNVHSWATAADIYRVGDSYLDDEKTIAKYAALADSLGPQVFVKPYAEGDDHLHFDLGFITMTPRECSER
ncbi:MAG: hypothetical protein H0X73_05085 [Chthoniobacterales bacterium]|nr:hypothetical protein [Chthoniobacterales bacterium]